MSDRGFDDDEVQEILERATEIRDRPPSIRDPVSPVVRSGHSLTLSELEDVAAEVGISPARITEAAATLELDRAVLPASRTQFGVPISAAHVVRLPRMLSPEEWDRFVVRLRDTFDATGAVRTEGSLQTWSNGNLKVLLEPLEDGARMRFQSLDSSSKGHFDGAMILGVTGLSMVLFLVALTLFSGKPMPAPLYGLSASLPAAGLGLVAVGRARAAQWLPERRSQFQALGAEAVRVVEDRREAP